MSRKTKKSKRAQSSAKGEFSSFLSKHRATLLEGVAKPEKGQTTLKAKKERKEFLIALNSELSASTREELVQALSMDFGSGWKLG